MEEAIYNSYMSNSVLHEKVGRESLAELHAMYIQLSYKFPARQLKSEDLTV